MRKSKELPLDRILDGRPAFDAGWMWKIAVDWRSWIIGIAWSKKNYWKTGGQYFVLHFGPAILTLMKSSESD
jgi:hypothetical protein